MPRKTTQRSTPLVRIFSWTFIVVYVLAALFAHYIGLRNRTYDAWPTTTYEPLSLTHAFEFALLIALIASIWVSIKWR
jgi:hypothetical protein